MSMLKHTESVNLKRYIARRGLFIRLPIPEGMKDVQPEIEFGRSILDRAVLDSVACSGTKEWFDTNNDYFNTICFIAYLDPAVVVERFEETYTKLLKEESIQEIYDKEIHD